jgi:drug/metabolite transporter (DMT)-like permease
MLDAARAASGTQWAILAVVAALGTGGHLLLILALGMAPTATLMPFVYAQIPFSTAISWLVFGQLPDAVAWLGMAVIMACGATAAWLNLRSRAAPAALRDAVAAD